MISTYEKVNLLRRVHEGGGEADPHIRVPVNRLSWGAETELCTTASVTYHTYLLIQEVRLSNRLNF